MSKNAFKKVYIFSNVFQAKNLAAGDEDGLSDPIVNLNHFGTNCTTFIFPQTLNPSWNQRLLIASWTVNGELPPMLLKVFDYDSTVIGDPDYEFLGGSVVNFEPDCLTNDPMMIPAPKWYDIRQDRNTVMGKILCSFTVLDGETPLPTNLPKQLSVQKSLHYIKIKILGLRDLESLGIMPVRRAFIKINLNSLKSVDQANAEVRLANIVTEPKEHGSSPNIGTVLTVEIALSNDVKLMPILSCNVMDSTLIGSKSIGNFEIDLGYFTLLYKSKLLLKLKKALNILKKKNSMRQIEKTQSVIDKFIRDIKSNESFVQLGDDFCEEEHEDSGESLLKFNKNTNLKIDDFDQDAGDDTEDAPGDELENNLFSIISNSSELFQKSTSQVHQKKPAILGILGKAERKEIMTSSSTGKGGASIDISNEELFATLNKSLYKNSSGKENKPEDDISVEYEGEDKGLLVKEHKIFTAVGREVLKVNPLFDSSIISKIPLLSGNDDSLMTEEDEKEETNVKQRSLPNNIRVQKSSNFVMMPKYKKKNSGQRTDLKIEYEMPDQTQFICLGYEAKGKSSKHYRYFLDRELEKSPYMGARQFKTVPIVRGKQIKGEEGFLSRMFKGLQDSVFKEVGKFKGVVDIISNEDLALLRDLELEKEGIKLNIPTQISDWQNVSPLELDLMRKNYVVIRIYIIDAEIYESYDMGSESDPYVKLSLGPQVIDDCKNAIENKNSPKFLRMFEFKTTFPGYSHLKVQFWDQDPIKFDELIGETTIDVENRFYDSKWRDLVHIPIETRKIYHPSSKQEKGTVRLWLEMFSAPQAGTNSFKKDEGIREKQFKNIWDISPRPPVELELRVIIWETNDVPMADVEDTVDIYVTAALPNIDKPIDMKTDVHYRSQTGFGSFNWRMKFPISVDQYTKKEQLRLALQIWDKDLLKSNEFLSEATIDVSQLIFEAIESESANKMFSPKGDDKILVPTVANATRGIMSKSGTILVSIEVVTKTESEKSPVGHGRSDPNQNPYLPAPTGRFEWTVNPLKLFTQLVGPRFRRKF